MSLTIAVPQWWLTHPEQYQWQREPVLALSRMSRAPGTEQTSESLCMTGKPVSFPVNIFSITNDGAAGPPAPLAIPSHVLQTTFSFPRGIKILAFPLLLQREPGQSPGSTRLFLPGARYQCQHECNLMSIAPVGSEGPVGKTDFREGSLV